MSIILNKEVDFIERSKKTHGDKYDYSLVDYKNCETKVNIICPVHGTFEQAPYKHLIGHGCYYCKGGLKLSNDEFIDKAKKIHGDKYDYSLVDYKNSHSKIKIICRNHGIFEQTPNSHLKKNGCILCSGLKKLNTDEFVSKSKKIHGDKYDYSISDYKNCETKVKIICKKHGIFEQVPNYHMKGSICPKCNIENNIKNRTLTNEEFIDRSKKIHGDKYDYSMFKYEHNKKEGIIICSLHGEFKQIPNNHLNGKGCPICSESKGEKEIRKILNCLNINFIPQKKFLECKSRNRLSFDFYLPEKNLCIEYDGIQHFKSIDFFGGDSFLKYYKEKDKIKEQFCEKNKIDLLRIKYDENILEKISSVLNPLH